MSESNVPSTEPMMEQENPSTEAVKENETPLAETVTEKVLRHAEATIRDLIKGNLVDPSINNIDEGVTPKAEPKVTKTGAGEGASKINVDSGDNTPEVSRCLVYCRMRPPNKSDYLDNGTEIVKLEGKSRITVKDEWHYDYDGTFGRDATQEQIFETVAVPCVQHAFKGFCSALMCYGQTGTGKTFTMCNTDPANEGVIPRAARYIYNMIDEKSEAENRSYTVVGQFVQIYRDQLGDLMTGGGKERVEIRYDADEGVTLTGCSLHTLHNAKEFMRFYNEGNSRRVVMATAMNPESSRGHTAMIVWIVSECPENPEAGSTKGKITFIDLAGYERFSKTGITNANPIMKDEAKTINASLLALGHVVSSLSSGGKHIPWRDAKLTRILQDSIGGRSRTSIILTVSPSSNHLHETTNTLQFGLRSMAVKVHTKAVVSVDYQKLARKLTTMLNERDERISVLELQIANRDAERQELLARYQQDRDVLEERFETDLERITTTGGTEEQIAKLKEVYRIEIQNLQEQQAEELHYQDEIHSKELSELLNEQKHREAKNLTAMKINQQNLIEEFQRKLEEARGNKNEDLVGAIQQLSEKDEILASRASEMARLHAQIEALNVQIQELGAQPVSIEESEFPELFMDISQVDDMKNRFNSDIERLHSKLVDVQTQLDRMTTLCNDRAAEIDCLMEENQKLRDDIEKDGARTWGSNDGARTLRIRRGELVNASDLETLRLRMQADLDDVISERNALKRELAQYKERPKSFATTWSKQLISTQTAFNEAVLNATVGQEHLLDSTITAVSNINEKGGAVNSLSSYRSVIKKLNLQLAESARREANLQARIRALEQGSVEHVDTSAPLQTENATHVDPVERSNKWWSDISSLAQKEDPDVNAVLLAREAELKTQEDLILEQERRISLFCTAHKYNQMRIQCLKSQLVECGVTPTEPEEAPQPVESLPQDDYITLLRELRHANRKLTIQLLQVQKERSANADVSANEDDGNAHSNAAGSDKVHDFEGILQAKDNELNDKDRLLIEKSTMLQYIAKVGTRLIHQLQTLGATPCCTIPKTYADLANGDLADLEIQLQQQRELEENLEKVKKEKQKLREILYDLTRQNIQKSNIIQDVAHQNEELRRSRQSSAEAIMELKKHGLQREQFYKDAARRATQELIAMQIRVANREMARRVTFFERFIGFFPQ